MKKFVLVFGLLVSTAAFAQQASGLQGIMHPPQDQTPKGPAPTLAELQTQLNTDQAELSKAEDQLAVENTDLGKVELGERVRYLSQKVDDLKQEIRESREDKNESECKDCQVTAGTDLRAQLLKPLFGGLYVDLLKDPKESPKACIKDLKIVELEPVTFVGIGVAPQLKHEDVDWFCHNVDRVKEGQQLHEQVSQAYSKIVNDSTTAPAAPAAKQDQAGAMQNKL